MPVAQRTFARSVRIARPAREVIETDGVGSIAEWAESERGHRRPEDRERRCANGGGEMLRRRVVGDEQPATANDLGGSEQRQLARRVDGRAAGGVAHLVREWLVCLCA